MQFPELTPDIFTSGFWGVVEWHLPGHSNAADIVGGSGADVIRLFSDLCDVLVAAALWQVSFQPIDSGEAVIRLFGGF